MNDTDFVEEMVIFLFAEDFEHGFSHFVCITELSHGGMSYDGLEAETGLAKA